MDSTAIRTPLYRTCDIELYTETVYQNPFEEIDVMGTFLSPSGKILNILGFYDGKTAEGKEKWVVRFAPTEEGLWQYRIQSSDLDPELSRAGFIEGFRNSEDKDIFKKGFLKVSPDKRILTYADGDPFFWLADTHWTFVTEERFAESNAPGTGSQFKACVDKRVQQGFTVYLCTFRDNKVAGIFGNSTDLMHENEDGSFSPNIKAFQENVDPKMDYLKDVGLVIAVSYAWGYDMPSGGVERYKKLAKYTAARYGAYPVVWTLAGELPGYGPDKDEMIPLWNEVAKECEKWCAYENLQTVHLACSRPFPKLYEKESWFDFALCQSGHGDMSMAPVMYKEFREMYEGHPVAEGETFYEGIWSRELVPRYVDADLFRRNSYLIMQMGGAGVTYGANGVWELQWERGEGGIGWGDMAWYEGLELPGADQMTVLKDFYESVGWGDLHPLGKDRFISGGGFFGEDPEGNRTIYATGNAEMTKVVLYLQPTAMRSYEIRGLTGKTYHLYEIDTETGEKTLLETVVPENGVFRDLSDGNFRMSHGKPHDRLFFLTALSE